MGNIGSLKTKTNVKLFEMQKSVIARGKDSLCGAQIDVVASEVIGERVNMK